MFIGQIVVVQPLTLSIGGLLLEQDEALKIIDITNSKVIFERLKDGSVNEVSKMGLKFAVE